MEQQFTIWCGGQAGDPEDFGRAAAIAPLPAPTPLPRIAFITHWWGKTRLRFAAAACSVRTTPWGNGSMTWLHFKGREMTDGPDERTATITVLVPAHHVTAVQPGPEYTLKPGGPGGVIGLFPPRQPAPPHALPLAEVERALAGLADATADAHGFAIRYPLFALRHPNGDPVGFGPHAGPPAFGVPVFSTEAAATGFLGDLDRRSQADGARVERFDRLAPFRRFLRSIRDSGTFVLFDPVGGPDGFLYVDHAHPAGVVLERFLPQVAWGWGYPVFVLRLAGPGLSLATAEGALPDGRRVTVLPVFTDADLADRALPRVGRPAAVQAVADSPSFAQLVRELPAGFGVLFDHEPARGTTGKVVLSREELLANLEDLEL
jgi:hypothetical protein